MQFRSIAEQRNSDHSLSPRSQTLEVAWVLHNFGKPFCYLVSRNLVVPAILLLELNLLLLVVAQGIPLLADVGNYISHAPRWIVFLQVSFPRLYVQDERTRFLFVGSDSFCQLSCRCSCLNCNSMIYVVSERSARNNDLLRVGRLIHHRSPESGLLLLGFAKGNCDCA